MSAAFVVDCSIAMAWLFQDEATPKTAGLLKRLATETALPKRPEAAVDGVLGHMAAHHGHLF